MSINSFLVNMNLQLVIKFKAVILTSTCVCDKVDLKYNDLKKVVMLNSMTMKMQCKANKHLALKRIALLQGT